MSESFLSKLSNCLQFLPGESIGDLKKNFHRLIRTPHSSTPIDQIHFVLDNVKPLTYLEVLLKIESLIYFKHTERLLQFLVQGNEVHISKLLKQHWFLQEVFNKMGADRLVNQLFLKLSFTVKMKVLKKLSMILSQERIDEIFESLEKRYGVWMAIEVLHACSKQKLQSVLGNGKIALRLSQVRFLLGRNSELFKIYIDYYKETYKKPYNARSISNYIANKDPVLFVILEKQQSISVSRLGKRASEKVFAAITCDVIENSFHYQQLLNEPVLIKKLGRRFRALYLKIFPKLRDPGHFKEDSPCRTMLKYLPKSQRWELFRETFFIVFPDDDLRDICSLIDPDLDISLNKDVIHCWAQLRFNTRPNLTVFSSPASLMQFIMKKIDVIYTPDNRSRMLSIEMLLRVCKINNDPSWLEKVLKFLCVDLADEPVNHKQKILQIVMKEFGFNDLNSYHWASLSTTIRYLQMCNELPIDTFLPLLRNRLEFYIEEHDYFNAYLRDFIQLVIYYHKNFALHLDNEVVEGEILKEMLFAFIEITGEIRRKYEDILMVDIMEFSEKHPDCYIDLGPNFLFTVKNSRCEENYSYRTIAKMLVHKVTFPECTLAIKFDENLVSLIVEYWKGRYFSPFGDKTMTAFDECLKVFLKKKRRNPFEGLLLDAYFRYYYRYDCTTNILRWYLKYDPRALSSSLQYVWENIFTADLRLIRIYQYMPDKAVIAERINPVDPSMESSCLNMVNIMRILSPTYEFANLINRKFTGLTPDRDDTLVGNAHALRYKIIGKLYPVERPSVMLAVISKLCVTGDFRHALPSIQWILHRSPENELYSYMEELSKVTDASVRKHAVFFSSQLLKKQYVSEILMKEEYLFTISLNYFKKYPSQELEQLIIKSLPSIQQHGRKYLKRFAEFPIAYMTNSFLEQLWALYDLLQNRGVDTNIYRKLLLNNVSSKLPLDFSTSFIKHIVDTCFTFHESTTSCLIEFVIKFLFKSNEKTKFTEIVMKRLKRAQKQNIRTFINHLTRSRLTVEFMRLFLKYWRKNFEMSRFFEEHILLNLVRFDSDTNNSNIAQNIVKYFEEIMEQFTFNAFDLIKDVFKEFLNTKEIEGRYELLYKLTNSKCSSFICVLTLSVLDRLDPSHHKLQEIYRNILDNIKNANEPIVDIYLRKYMENSSLENQ